MSSSKYCWKNRVSYQKHNLNLNLASYPQDQWYDIKITSEKIGKRNKHIADKSRPGLGFFFSDDNLSLRRNKQPDNRYERMLQYDIIYRKLADAFSSLKPN